MQKQQQKKPTPPKKGGKKEAKTRSLVRAPAAQNMSARSRGSRDVNHRECERVGTVVGSVSFSSVANYAINPGLQSSFPWLSGVAQHFERYKINHLTVRYKNLKGTDTDGNILMSFDYDTLDPAPTSAVVQTQSTVYIDGAPWRIFEMRIPSDGTKKFIRSSSVAGSDLKTYDFGRVWVSAEGCADASDHGYLEFDYSVTLYEKQTAGASSSIANRTFSQWTLQSDTASLGASAVLNISEAIIVASMDAPTNSLGTVTLVSPGYYLITVEIGCLAASTGDTGSNVGIRVNGAQQSPPIIFRIGGTSASSDGSMGSCCVLSDGTTTVDAYFGFNTDAHTFLGRSCRLSVLAL